MTEKVVVRTMNVGMCNQLFTYAFARYISERDHKEIWLDYSNTSSVDMKHKAMYEDSLAHYSLKVDGVINDGRQYQEIVGDLEKELNRLRNPFLIRKKNRKKYFVNQEKRNYKKYAKKGLLLNTLVDCDSSYYEEYIGDNVLLYGYWQVPRYARNIEELLREEIVAVTEKNLQKDVKKTELIMHIKETDSVCIHIRRGDYVGDKMHDVCTKEYYARAVERVKDNRNNLTFFVFSDDIQEVKEEYYDIFGDSNVEFCDANLPDYEELVVMSFCKHFILSNSSFSWWAQFLSESKDVLAPSKWYGEEGKNTLLYEEHWKLLEV